jgi:hypothetical protein
MSIALSNKVNEAAGQIIVLRDRLAQTEKIASDRLAALEKHVASLSALVEEALTEPISSPTSKSKGK